MTEKIDYDDLATRFHTVFCNLPISERSMSIVVIDKWGPVSWLVAKIEIKHKTNLSKEILEKMSRMKLI